MSLREIVSPSLLWPSVRDGGEPFARGGRPLPWRGAAAVLAFWTAFGLLRAGVWWLVDPNKAVTAPLGLVHSLARTWLWAALTPAIWLVCDRLPFSPRRLPLLAAAHAAGATLAALAETAWFRATLVVLHPDLSLRPFASRFLVDYTANTFLYLTVAAFGYARRHRAILDERRVDALRLRARSTEARLHVLMRQLQPHFVCNALNAIAELVHRDIDRARRTLAQLRALLVGPLAAATPPEVPLARELELLDAYVAVQRARFGDRLTIATRVDPAALPRLVPSFLLQPLVENAVRHGVGRRAAPGRVDVSAAILDGRLDLRVRDDGPGPSDAPREGVGLRNTRRRLAALYGRDAELRLDRADGGGAEAVVVLPLRDALPPAAAAPRPPRGPLPPPPRPWQAVAAVLAAWAALGVLWAVIRVLINPYVPIRVGLVDELGRSLRSAGVFAAATLVLYHASRAWPIERRRFWGRLALHVVITAAAVLALPFVRYLVHGWEPFVFDDVAAVNLLLDASVCVVVAAASHAVLDLERARARELEAAQLEDELAAAALAEQRLRLDPPALAAAIDDIAAVAARDPERADELIVGLGDRLRAMLVEEDA